MLLPLAAPTNRYPFEFLKYEARNRFGKQPIKIQCEYVGSGRPEGTDLKLQMKIEAMLVDFIRIPPPRLGHTEQAPRSEVSTKNAEL